MATAMKRCRVCDKLYEACHKVVGGGTMFRWQDVACSPECGSIYLQQILESRGEVPKQEVAEVATKTATKEAIYEEMVADDEDVLTTAYLATEDITENDFE